MSATITQLMGGRRLVHDFKMAHGIAARMGWGVQTIDMADAAVTLSTNTDNTQLKGNILLVDPNSSGSAEILKLPAEADIKGFPLLIWNTGGEDITLQNDAGGAIGTIANGMMGMVACDGTTSRLGLASTTAAVTLFGDGTAAAPSISFNSDPDTGIFWEDNNQISFALAGVDSVAFAQASDMTHAAGTDAVGADVFMQAADAGPTATTAKVGGLFETRGGDGSIGTGAFAGGAGGLSAQASGAGGANTGGATGEAGGAGGAANLVSGAGGATDSTGAHAGGVGGAMGVTSGAGGAQTGGTGAGGAAGDLTYTGGVGGANSFAGSSAAGGKGGAFIANAGAGGATASTGAHASGAGGAITLLAGAAGTSTGVTTTAAGTGGAASLTAGAGGVKSTGGVADGGVGGGATLQSGAGGAHTAAAAAASGGAAGALNLVGGAGGATDGTGASVGGAGSTITATGGAGGAPSAGTGAGGAGGGVILQGGDGANSTGGNGGAGGNVDLIPGINGTGGTPANDGAVRVLDPNDNTKILALDVSPVTTGTTRILTAPDHNIGVSGVAYAAAAASTAITGTTETQTAFDTNVTLPANSLKAGTVVHIIAQGIHTATTGAETHDMSLEFGAVALDNNATVDPANSDIFFWDVYVTIRTAGTGGTMVAVGTKRIGAAGTAGVPFILAETAIDTTATQLIAVEIDRQATATDSDSARLDSMIVLINGVPQ